ncbi:unnamed protein product, partial [Prorocentrum cordatum]
MGTTRGMGAQAGPTGTTKRKRRRRRRNMRRRTQQSAGWRKKGGERRPGPRSERWPAGACQGSTAVLCFTRFLCALLRCARERRAGTEAGAGRPTPRSAGADLERGNRSRRQRASISSTTFRNVALCSMAHPGENCHASEATASADQPREPLGIEEAMMARDNPFVCRCPGEHRPNGSPEARAA